MTRRLAVFASVMALLLLGSDRARAAPSVQRIVIIGTVTAIIPAGGAEPSRWNVILQVERVRKGTFSESTFTLTVENPARAGLKIGGRYRVEAIRKGDAVLVVEITVEP